MKVLLVDDHPAILSGVEAWLDGTDGMEVVGEARDAEEAIRLTGELKPDLVILDLRLRGEVGGVEACREIKSLPEPPPRVLIHSAHNAVEDLALVILAGADGYLYKGVEQVGLPEVVSRVYAGEPVWLVDVEPEEAKSHLVETLRKAKLTRKESEVLPLMLERCSNPEIARRLCLRLPTVKTHVRKILRKLKMKDRKELFF